MGRLLFRGRIRPKSAAGLPTVVQHIRKNGSVQCRTGNVALVIFRRMDRRFRYWRSPVRRIGLATLLSLAVLAVAPVAFAAGEPKTPVDVLLPVGHATPPNLMTFSPDGRFILAGSIFDDIRLWNVATGELVRNYLGHTAAITALAFSADGRYFASGSEDKTVRIWNVALALPFVMVWIVPVVYWVGDRQNRGWIDEAVHFMSYLCMGWLNFALVLCAARDGLLLATGDDAGKVILWDFSAAGKERSITLKSGVMALKVDVGADTLVASAATMSSRPTVSRRWRAPAASAPEMARSAPPRSCRMPTPSCSPRTKARSACGTTGRRRWR